MNDDLDRDMVVFSEAINLPEAERAGYLERACAGDAGLKSRVEALFRALEKAGDFMCEPPPGLPGAISQAAFIGEKPGDWIGRYQLLQQIGEGGHGVVFMAEQKEPIHRQVALKVIKPGMDTKSVIARFEAERQALALMDHPNIAKVFDAGATGSGRPYFVMELIRGVRITEYCDQHSLTTGERLKLFIQVCHTAQHAHQKGIIHRDIKPSNILVTQSEEGAAVPVMIDFGIAKATGSQRLTDKTLFTAFEMLIGTPAYMSPEQAEFTSVDVDTRTDIYSLGALLYELLTGSTPFETGDLLKAGLDEIRRVIRDEEPARPSTRLKKMTAADITTIARQRQSEPPKLIRSVHGDLDWIVMKALEKERRRRYATANGLALDVQRFLDGETILARPPSALYKFQKTVLLHKLLFVGTGIIAALLVAGLIVVSTLLAKERQARREADVARMQAEGDKAKAQTEADRSRQARHDADEARMQAERDKAKAETEAVKSRQVTQFLEDMLQGVGPSMARGRDTTMLREILDRTAERVGPEMTNQPAVEAELRGLIGRLYFEIGNYDGAEKMQQVAVVMDRKLYGPESAEAATSLHDVGLTLSKEGNLAGAESTLEQTVKSRRKLFGDTNADVADSLNALATVYRHERRLAESDAATREALGIRQKLFGDESLPVADSLHNLCVVLGDEGLRAESEATARKMLAMRRKLLGSDDPAVAAALNDVAWAATFNGKLDEAESLQREAIAIQRKFLGDENPVVATTLSSLGQSVAQRGNLTEADALLSAALSIQRKVLAETNPDLLYTLDSLGRTMEGENKWPEAEAAHREALAAWRRRGGNEDPHALVEAEGLVHALVAQKKFGEAEKLLDEVLTPSFIKQPTSVNLLTLRVDLLSRQGRWREAVAAATLALQYDPGDYYKYHTLAGLLAVTHNRSAYEQLCSKILATFGNTKESYIADRTAQDCLLLPDSGVNLHLVDKLADVAVTLGNGDYGLPFFQAGKAMSEYRQGHFSEAVDWGEKSLDGSIVDAQAKACAVLAMADWQLGRKDVARALLARGDLLAPRIASTTGPVDLGDAWISWLFARVSLDEAAALIEPGGDNGKK